MPVPRSVALSFLVAAVARALPLPCEPSVDREALHAWLQERASPSPTPSTEDRLGYERGGGRGRGSLASLFEQNYYWYMYYVEQEREEPEPPRATGPAAEDGAVRPHERASPSPTPQGTVSQTPSRGGDDEAREEGTYDERAEPEVEGGAVWLPRERASPSPSPADRAAEERWRHERLSWWE